MKLTAIGVLEMSLIMPDKYKSFLLIVLTCVSISQGEIDTHVRTIKVADSNFFLRILC